MMSKKYNIRYLLVSLVLTSLLLPAATYAKGEMAGRLRYYAAVKKENMLLERGLYRGLKYTPDTSNQRDYASTTLENIFSEHPVLGKSLAALEGMAALKKIKTRYDEIKSTSVINEKMQNFATQAKEKMKIKMEEWQQKRKDRKEETP